MFINENLQLLAFWRAFYGMIANIFLNLLFIKKYGIQGVAVATLISQIIAAYMFDLFNKNTRNLFLLKIKSLFMINTLIRIIRVKHGL